MWIEHSGGVTAEEQFDEVMAIGDADPFWELTIADPGPSNLFADPVYDRGAATLHALRVKVGDDVFFEGVRRWIARFADADATTEDFQADYEQVSGLDLSTFFDVWLRTPEKPTAW